MPIATLPFLPWCGCTPASSVVASKGTDSYADADESLDGYHLNYYGCVTALDRAIGRLRARLREHGIAENTLVAFTSDNGPEGSDGLLADEVFKGGSGLYEGGVRVPGLLEWPGRSSPERVAKSQHVQSITFRPFLIFLVCRCPTIVRLMVLVWFRCLTAVWRL